MTVPYVAAGEPASVEMGSAVGEASRGSIGSAVEAFAGETELVPVASGGGAQLANMELAAIKLPVTDAISFNASRRESLPSS